MANTAMRWSGLLLIAGAVLLGIGIVLVSFKPSEPFSPLMSIPLLLSSILLLLSLPSMYAKQASAVGWLGLAGHALLQTGMLLFVVVFSMPLRFPSFNPTSGENVVDFFLGIALTLGLLLTAVATIRAKIFPRWAGILLLAATVGFFFDFFIAELVPNIAGQIGTAILGIVLALALAGIGLSMWTS